jgi:hypothetical protein
LAVRISHTEAQVGRKGIHKSRHTKTLHIKSDLDERKKRSGNKKEDKVKEKRNNYKEIKEEGGL